MAIVTQDDKVFQALPLSTDEMWDEEGQPLFTEYDLKYEYKKRNGIEESIKTSTSSYSSVKPKSKSSVDDDIDDAYEPEESFLFEDEYGEGYDYGF